MSFSATRMTCFALLSALEEDLRYNILELFDELPVGELLSESQLEKAQERRIRDAGSQAEPSLAGLLHYLDMGDAFDLLKSHKSRVPSEYLDSLQGLETGRPRLIAIRNRVAHTRPMEIDDSAVLLDAATTALQRDEWWPALSETVQRLRDDPSYVLGLSIDWVVDEDRAVQHNLPVPDFDDSGFFGRQEELRRIKKALKGAYPVVSVLGDGGIGKTSIALKAAYELLEDPKQPFEAIVWVTAKATILTNHEIKRISGAIESSVGLFASAAEELGGSGQEDPIGEVLNYLENFRILLVLDNLETVLDERLRSFLLDLPIGSKVLVTSRISLGIENPIKLGPLSTDESSRLIHALARVRRVETLRGLDADAVRSLAERMNGHPGYIRWLVAGVQTGRRPEELIADNALLLDYCMSNVYEHLNEGARRVLRSMQVLSGARSQSQLAYLNEYSAEEIQGALLELLTTNFVRMSSSTTQSGLATVYELSDFARQYLDKHHQVTSEERSWLLGRNDGLRELGLRLAADASNKPYAASTISIERSGDVHVARLLKDAIRAADLDPARALSLCVEAQLLAPSYYEVWRVEAHLRERVREDVEAHTAYGRAIETAPESPQARFHYGSFLLNLVGDPAGALKHLQAAAKADPGAPEIVGQIAWAHFCTEDFRAAASAAFSVLGLERAGRAEREAGLLLALRASVHAIRRALAAEAFDRAGELIEHIVDLTEELSVDLMQREALDWIAELYVLAGVLANADAGYASTGARQLRNRLVERRRRSDAAHLDRKIGNVKSVHEKGFGFVRSDGVEYFFHYRDLRDGRQLEVALVGSTCAFDVVPNSPKGPRARNVRVLG